MGKTDYSKSSVNVGEVISPAYIINKYRKVYEYVDFSILINNLKKVSKKIIIEN